MTIHRNDHVLLGKAELADLETTIQDDADLAGRNIGAPFNRMAEIVNAVPEQGEVDDAEATRRRHPVLVKPLGIHRCGRHIADQSAALFFVDRDRVGDLVVIIRIVGGTAKIE